MEVVFRALVVVAIAVAKELDRDVAKSPLLLELRGGVEKSKSRMGILNFLVGQFKVGPPRKNGLGWCLG